MKMWRDAIEREIEIILPATIRENWHGDMLIPEVAMVQKEEFNKVPKELIRCKDCKKNGTLDCPLFTDAVEFEMDGKWFCADGER